MDLCGSSFRESSILLASACTSNSLYLSFMPKALTIVFTQWTWCLQLTVPIIHAKSSLLSSTMNPSRPMISRPIKIPPFVLKTCNLSPYSKRVSGFSPHGHGIRFSPAVTKCSRARDVHLAAAEATQSSCSSSRASPVIASKILDFESIEENIEKVYNNN